MAGRHGDPCHPQNEALRAFVRAALGRGVRIEDVSRDVGRLSIVWRLDGPDGAVHFVKQHEAINLYSRERLAYERWVPQLRDVPGICIPEVVARDDALGALILTALPRGTLVSELGDETAPEPAYWHAGRFLRALHDLPLPAPAPEMVAHMRALIAKYVLPHDAPFETATFDWIVRVLDEGRPFAGAPYVCAHRDFSPRNWILTPDGRLGVIDWERAQPDVWLADVTRMEFDVWPAHPSLRDAFFKGFGMRCTARVQRQIELAALIHAVASVAWAAERGDTHFEALGRATIRRLERGTP